MKKSLIMIVMTALSLAASSCIRKASDVYMGEPASDKQITKTIETGNFDQIQVSGSLDIIYTQSETTSFKLEGTEDAVNNLVVENQDGCLNIYSKKSSTKHTGFISLGGHESNTSLKAYVSAKTLRHVAVSGAGDFTSKRPIVTDEFGISISGAGDVEIEDLTAKKFDCTISGAGDVDFLVRKADIKLSVTGAGDVEGTLVDCGFVTTRIAGAGDVELKGNAKRAENSVFGVGNINLSKLKLEQ